MRKNSLGFTLVEVVIAMLLTTVIVSAVFSLALTIKAGNVKTDRRLIADQYARQLTSVLKSYVTADCSASNISGITAPNGSWSLSGVHGPGGSISDSCGSCYALAPGYHVLKNFIPGTQSSASTLSSASPYNGKICYNVSYSGSCAADTTCTNTSVGTPPCQSASAGNPPSVCVNVTWSEPKP